MASAVARPAGKVQLAERMKMNVAQANTAARTCASIQAEVIAAVVLKDINFLVTVTLVTGMRMYAYQNVKMVDSVVKDNASVQLSGVAKYARLTLMNARRKVTTEEAHVRACVSTDLGAMNASAE